MSFEPENKIERAVRDELEAMPLGLDCDRLDHPGSYPDYRVTQLGTGLFIVEVKELRCVKDTDGPNDLDAYLKEATPWEFDDLTRVLRFHLRKASKQFVNAERIDVANKGLPRVLWFRTELAVSVEDFERAIKGVFAFDKAFDDCDPSIRDDAELQATLENIDAIVWQPVNGAMPHGIRISDRATAERRRMTIELVRMLHEPMQRAIDAERKAHSLPLWANGPRKLFGDPIW